MKNEDIVYEKLDDLPKTNGLPNILNVDLDKVGSDLLNECVKGIKSQIESWVFEDPITNHTVLRNHYSEPYIKVFEEFDKRNKINN